MKTQEIQASTTLQRHIAAPWLMKPSPNSRTPMKPGCWIRRVAHLFSWCSPFVVFTRNGGKQLASVQTRKDIREILEKTTHGIRHQRIAIRLAALSLYLTAIELGTQSPCRRKKLAFSKLRDKVLFNFRREGLTRREGWLQAVWPSMSAAILTPNLTSF